MKNILQNLLAFLARTIIKKYKPKIIGITGSVGKTSTKEAVFAVVNQKFKSYRAAKNFNDELGLPLAIVGYNDNPQKNLFTWLQVLLRAIRLILVRSKYPEVLILEYGIDKPGDMDYLVSIAKPDIAIITSIGVSHYEFFNDAGAIEFEKGKLAQAVPATGVVIVNADNEKALAQKLKSKGSSLSYSTTGVADISIVLKTELVDATAQTIFEAKTSSRQFEASVNAIGRPHLAAITAAIAVAEYLKIETDLVVKGILEYKPAPGRLNIIGGIKHSTIIDDTYNAAEPQGVIEGLAVFDRLPGLHKIAVLGTMRELGDLSDESHDMVGKMLSTVVMDHLITIGDGGKQIAESAVASGFPAEKVLSFPDSDSAKQVIQDILQPEGLIWIKGSQYVRMEKITKEIMAEPMRAKELLCRQYGTWLST